jgi:hypothetical protein
VGAWLIRGIRAWMEEKSSVMKSIKTTLLIILILTGVCFSSVEASWVGPQTIISGGWGSADNEFENEWDYTYHRFPIKIIVLANGDIWIPDGYVNKRLKLYSNAGKLKKIIKLHEESHSFPEYWFIGQFEGVGFDGTVYMSNYMGKGLYAFYSPTGELIKTTLERPLQLGKVEVLSLENKQYKTTVTYDDAIYRIKSDKKYNRFARDKNKNIYAILPALVDKYSEAGILLGRLQLPEPVLFRDDALPVEYERYLDPIIDVNGNIYRWEATLKTYSIIKWTWVDDHSTK